MKLFFQKNHRILFYGSWLLLGLVQASFTELQDDEAYYWVYAKFLAWGYYDHPPMIGLLIKAGYALFSNALGVRLFPLILSTLTLFITEKLIEKKNHLLFYALCLSIAALQLAGFWAVPDTPLLFFTALFFLCYHHFIIKPSWQNIFLLGVSVACLFYSKYHGLLVVVFTLLSNTKLLKQRSTYMAGLIAFLLYLPHVWWQYQHDWISFKFQLFENKAHPYKLSYTTDYIAGQLLIAGPLSGIIFLVSTFAYKAKSTLEKALQYTAVGIFIFFFFSAFRGQVEANWTAPAMIPMLVLTHQYLQQHIKWKQWLFRLLPFTLLIVLAARVIMIADIVPASGIVEKFHAWKRWPQVLKQKTKGLPVVFNNSYQRASKYWFYTGQETYSLNSYQERINNYNFWPVEDSLLGKNVYILDIYNLNLLKDSIKAPMWEVGYAPDSNFHSFTKIKIRTEKNKYAISENDSVVLNFTTDIPALYNKYLQQHPSIDAQVKVGFFTKEAWIKDIDCSFTLQQLRTTPHQQITIRPDMKKGRYYLVFAMSSSSLYYTHNSDKIQLDIK